MPGLTRREPRGEAAGIFSRFDRLFEEWARMMPFPHWREVQDLIRVPAMAFLIAIASQVPILSCPTFSGQGNCG